MIFDNFGDYMVSLLPSPPRRAKGPVNQFKIFFIVAGRQFDDVKAAILRIRQQANLLTADDRMLDVHGADRQMPRLAGEDGEGYRRRLILRRQIAQAGGTDQAFDYLALAVGYEGADQEMASDPDKWAEMTLRLYGGRFVVDDRALLLTELRKVKAAGAKIELRTEQRYTGAVYLAGAMEIGKIVSLSQEGV